MLTTVYCALLLLGLPSCCVIAADASSIPPTPSFFFLVFWLLFSAYIFIFRCFFCDGYPITPPQDTAYHKDFAQLLVD